MSLCHQCVYYHECSQSGLPNDLVRNILFMATSIEERNDLLKLIGLLYDQELQKLSLDKETVLQQLYPLTRKCPYLT